MKNVVIREREARDIDKLVAKVLRGLGNPEPPVDLVAVRELRKLDVRYYSTTDDSMLREFVSRVKVGAKQLAMRPSLLKDVVTGAGLSALLLPDKKRILIDADEPKLRHRWLESHEHGHDICPWHERYAFGDNRATLNPACQAELEAEANYAAGQLLFLQDRFVAEANDLPPAIGSIEPLSKSFGNTLTTTLWRFVEEAHQPLPMVGIVSQHPRRRKADFDPVNPCKHVIESPSFRERFGSTSETALFDIISSYCGWRTRGPLGEGTYLLTDRNGDRAEFRFESFSNHYTVLTLGVFLRPADAIINVL